MSDPNEKPSESSADLNQFQGPRREREGGGTQTRPPDESSDPSAEPVPGSEPADAPETEPAAPPPAAPKPAPKT